MKSDVYFSTSPFRLASFQVPSGHIKVVATALDRAVLDAWGYNSEQSRSSCPPLPAWTKHLHPLQFDPGALTAGLDLVSSQHSSQMDHFES